MDKRVWRRATAMLIVISMIASIFAVGMPQAVYAAEDTVNFSGGDGTLANPYKVSSAAELSNVNIPGAGAYFQQTGDIHLTGNWTPLGTFRGIYDGNGFGIYNMNMNSADVMVGLFSELSGGAVLKNMTLADFNITATGNNAHVGGLVGYTASSATVTDSKSNGLISFTDPTSVGGLVGNNAGTISNSSSNSVITSGADVFSAGGLVGVNAGSIMGSSASGSVNANHLQAYAGGLAGMNAGTVSDSESSSTVTTGDASSAGGLIGSNTSSGTINNSFGSGNASGKNSSVVGGLVGRNAGNINGSYSTGNTDADTDGMAGGLVGYKSGGSINNSYSTGSASGDNSVFVGGLIGMNMGDVSNSYSAGIASGGRDANGGLIGYNPSGNVTNSYYYNMSAATSAGGSAKSDGELMQQATYSTWDFNNVWRVVEGYTYPSLQWQSYTPKESTALDYVNLTWDSIKGTNSSENNVTADLNLPTNGAAGSTIIWSASASGLINPSTGQVTRATDDDHAITLTATISKSGGQTRIKPFNLTVIEAPNNKPNRKAAVNATDNAKVTLNTPYTIDLSTIFEDTDSEPLSYNVAVNGAAAVAANTAYSYTPNTAAPVTLVFTASDGEDLSDDTYTIQLAVNQAPVRQAAVAAATTATVSLNAAYTLDLAAIFEDADADALTYDVSIDGAAAVIAAENYTYTPAAAGQFTLVFTANDGMSDSSDTYTVELTVNTLPVRQPDKDATAEVTVTVNTPFTLDLATIFADADGNGLTYKVSVDGSAAVAAAENYTYTPTTAGQVTLLFTANDGTIDSADTYTVKLTANTVPVRQADVDATTAAIVTVSTPYTIDLASIFEDADGDGLTYKVSVDGAVAVAATENYMYTPTAGGEYTLVFTANDGVIDSVDTYTVELTANTMPVRQSNVGATSNAVITLNGTYTLDLGTIFEDADGDGLTYKVSVDGAAAAAASENYTISPITAGQVTLVFSANDGTIDSTDIYTVELTVNTLPVRQTDVDATGTAAVTVNTPYLLDLAQIFEDADNHPLTYKVSVDGAAAVAAAESYTYTPTLAGTVTLLFTANDGFTDSTDTYTVTLTVNQPSNGNGSGNGGNGNSGGNGSSSGGSVVTPDYKVTVTGSVGATLPTLPVKIDSAAGRAVISIGELAGKIFASSETTVMTVPNIPAIKSYTLEVPADSLSMAQAAGELVFITRAGSIAIPANMLHGMAETNGKIASLTIGVGDKKGLSAKVAEAVGDRPLIELTLELNGVTVPWNNPTAPVEITIPYVPTAEELKNPEHIVIWYIDGSGNAISVPSGRYDAVSGTVTFETSHFSSYAVAYVHKTFADLGSVEWARPAIEMMASKGIIGGTSVESFSPTAPITRADYLVLLVKTLGLTTEFKENFADAEPNAYYYEALGIAKQLGLATGTGSNEFHPKERISRQEMMVLTARTLEKFKGIGAAQNLTVLESYSDKEDIAAYAESSLMLLVEEGLISGSGDKLNPRALTTRAEAAVFLHRIYSQY
ncbi:S-layer homology domain-containing protein [Paenibacillus algorifonticola]|uniref:S-layer homology domain-containing protein n=1 Tax=Paenibacillus algorifonticola TaxID=684063 RepID=A0A1I2CKJ3_9BACL|nr:S-layer homology domain-containing protein [Paenibacillus algorifonticola]SFE68867.1 S-layer homology domain-containing protein [Paenibacillus algorifonticola]